MGNDLMSAAGLIHIIEESRQNALKKVNEFLSRGMENTSYGDAYIDEISREIHEIYLVVSDKQMKSEILPIQYGQVART